MTVIFEANLDAIVIGIKKYFEVAGGIYIEKFYSNKSFCQFGVGCSFPTINPVEAKAKADMLVEAITICDALNRKMYVEHILPDDKYFCDCYTEEDSKRDSKRIFDGLKAGKDINDLL